jgi:hypothetical protein
MSVGMAFLAFEVNVFIVHRLDTLIVLIIYCYYIRDGTNYIHINADPHIGSVFGRFCDL